MEYVTTSVAICEAVWLRKLLTGLHPWHGAKGSGETSTHIHEWEYSGHYHQAFVQREVFFTLGTRLVWCKMCPSLRGSVDVLKHRTYILSGLVMVIWPVENGPGVVFKGKKTRGVDDSPEGNIRKKFTHRGVPVVNGLGKHWEYLLLDWVVDQGR
jgi:hypothetical protein